MAAPPSSLGVTAPPPHSTVAIPSVLLGGDLPCRRLLVGLWQTSGGWGPAVANEAAAAAIVRLASQGYTTFDAADHYGPAEDILGLVAERLRAEPQLPQAIEAFTKWCPAAGPILRASAAAAIGRSLARMRVPRIDLLQLHWWDYAMRAEMLACVHHVDALRKEGLIRHIGLTNFDTAHVELFLDEGVPIVSNQVQFSVVDTRPVRGMTALCARRGVLLLAYGSLLGGLLTDAWLNRPEPRSRAELATPSLGKYFNVLRQWGSWALFQELLHAMRAVADAHSGHGGYVAIAHVAIAWVLAQEAVGGVIVGLRAGLSAHPDNVHALALHLSETDLARIALVQGRGRDLYELIGDCGDEYRR